MCKTDPSFLVGQLLILHIFRLDDQEAALRGDDNGEKADIVSSMKRKYDPSCVWVSTNSLGLSGRKGQFAHFNCAFYSPQVKYIGETESWFNIKKEIIRSRGLLCKHCNLRGATLGCYYPSCNYVVHIPCAVNSGEWNPKAYHNIIDSEFFCSKHFHLQQERIMQKDEKFGNDISRGKEVLAIPWKGDKDYSYVDNMPSGYEYITENLDSDDVNVSLRDIESLPCCDCVDECTDLFSCSCLRGHLNYDKNGNLINLNSEVSFGYDLTIFECNAGCACSKRYFMFLIKMSHIFR